MSPRDRPDTSAPDALASADDLAVAFDRAFALPPPTRAAAPLRYLVLAVGETRYAVAVTDVSGVLSDRPVTPLPSRSAALRGVTSARGVLVPVYDLAALLGHPSSPAPRVLVILARATAIAFAVDAVLRHVDHPSAPGAAAPVVVADGVAVVALADLADDLAARAASPPPRSP